MLQCTSQFARLVRTRKPRLRSKELLSIVSKTPAGGAGEGSPALSRQVHLAQRDTYSKCPCATEATGRQLLPTVPEPIERAARP